MFSIVRLTFVLPFALATTLTAAPLDDPKGKNVDALGDPLPDGAIMRFGSNRLRHGQIVLAATFSPDGKRLASIGQDNHVRIWSSDDGREVARLPLAQFFSPYLLRFSPDGSLLVVANRNSSIAVLDWFAERVLWQENNQNILGCGWSSDSRRLVLARTDGVARIIDARTGKLDVECIRQPMQLSAAAFTARDKEVLAVGLDYAVRRFDATTGKLLGNIPFPKQIPRGGSLMHPRLAFSPDSSHLALCDNSSGFWIWPLDGEVRRITSKEVVVGSISLSISQDNRFVATGNAEGSASIWGVESGKVLRSIYVSRFQSTAVLSPDARRLAAFSTSERLVRLWDVADNRPIGPEHEPGDTYTAMFLNGGKTVVTSTNQGHIHAWDVATGKVKDRYDNNQSPLVSIGSSDDKTVRAIDNMQRTVVWELGKKGETRVRAAPAIPFKYPIYHAPNGEWLVMRNMTNEIAIRDSESGKELKTLKIENRNLGFTSFQMSPDLRWLMALDNNRTMWVWEVADGRLHSSFGTLQQTQVANLSPDGRLVLAWEPTALVVWEAASARERLRIARTIATIRCFAVTRDCRLILIGNQLGELFLLDAADGKEIKRIAAHNGGIRSISFPKSGSHFLTVGDDGTALAWDADRLAGNLPVRALPAENVREWMNDLSSLSGDRAATAIRLLAAYPEATLKLLRTLAKPQVDETAQRIAALIGQLDHARFKVREDASKELSRYGVDAKRALEEAVKRAPSEDARVRMESLLKKINGGAVAIQSLREYRLVEVLERIGTPEARAEIAEMAKGPADAPIVREAKAVLERWTNSGPQE